MDVAVLELGLTGATDEDERSPSGAVGNERAAQLGAKARGCQEVTKACALLWVTTGRLVERRRLTLGAGKLFELIDILDGVLVIRQDREPVRYVLQTVLGDQIRSRVERVPARAIERDGTLQPSRGLVEELRALWSTKREPFEVGQQALRCPRPSPSTRDALLPGSVAWPSVPP